MTQPLPDETPEVLDGPSPLLWKSWLSRPVARVAGGGLVVLLIVVAVLAATGVFRGPQTIAVHGTQFVIADPFRGRSVEQTYPDVTDGTEVTIVNPAGDVVAASTLVVDPA